MAPSKNGTTRDTVLEAEVLDEEEIGVTSAEKRGRAAKPAAAEPATLTNLYLPPLMYETHRFSIVGENPLIVHSWSEKAKQEMRDKQQGAARGKKAPKVPHEEYNGARYVFLDRNGEEYDAFRAVSFKKAAVAACRQVQGMTMALAKSAFIVVNEYCRLECEGERVPKGGKPEAKGQWPELREDMVRVSNGVADLRYRPEYPVGWRTTVDVRFNATVITLEQVLYLLTIAGQSVGVCENRPEKSGDSFGLFRVDSTERIS